MENNKIYRCVDHGVIEESNVEFGPEPGKAEVSKKAGEDIRFVEVVIPQQRWHKNCGMPVEIG